MLDVLIGGRLLKDPTEGTTKTNKPFLKLVIQVPQEGGDPLAVLAMVFDSQLVDALKGLGKGDAISVAGRAVVSTYATKDGSHRASMQVTVTRAMSAYQSKQKRDHQTALEATMAAYAP